MRNSIVRSGIVVSTLAAVALGGCATGIKVGSGDVVADRQRLMKLQGASWKDIQDKAKAGQWEAIAVNAETIALNAEHIPALFPSGSLTDKSKAKPEVWQKWADFQATAKKSGGLAAALRDASRAKDQARVQAMLKDFGKEACGACHTPFRVPPKQ
jgi:cytochrome c556